MYLAFPPLTTEVFACRSPAVIFFFFKTPDVHLKLAAVFSTYPLTPDRNHPESGSPTIVSPSRLLTFRSSLFRRESGFFLLAT